MKTKTRSLVIMGVLTAIELIFLTTPIGTIPIGPLSISLGTIPIALAAIAVGTGGSTAMGAIFGIMSFLQCLGIGMPGGMGEILIQINPFLTFAVCMVPRVLDGVLVGLIFRLFRRIHRESIGYFVSGFSAACLNTVLFMTMLVLSFQNTEYMQGLMAGKGIFAFIVGLVGVNAIAEAIAVTVVAGAAGIALSKAKLLPRESNSGT